MVKIFPRIVKSTLLAGVVGILASVVMLASCQSRFIYFPRPYGTDDISRWEAQPGTRIVKFNTNSGPQQAYLLSPNPAPEHLWIVCAGNGTLALEWADWLREHAPAEDAWLMFDLPGYGACSGTPRPGTIRESIQSAIPAAAGALNWKLEAHDRRLRFFGHSLGSAVSLMAAKEFGMERGVVLTPFTSSMEMSRVITGVPLGFLIWHRFDNEARLKEMARRGNCKVFAIHGTNDESIPVAMSRQLAKEVPTVVRLTEVPGGLHNNLKDIAPGTIVSAILKARQESSH